MSDNKEIVLDEVYDIIPTSFWQTWVGYLIIASITAAIILLIALIITLILWYKRTPSARANSKLKLLLKKLDKKFETKAVYTNLISILKQYVTAQFNIKFTGITDTEILDQLKFSNCPKNLVEKLAPTIKNSEVAKFGHKEFNKFTVENDIFNVINFVQNSTKR